MRYGKTLMSRRFWLACGLSALVSGCASQPASVPVVTTRTQMVVPVIPEGLTSTIDPCVLPLEFTNQQIAECYRANLMLIYAANERMARFRGYIEGLRAQAK